MFDKPKNQNTEQHSDSELKAWLRQAFPTINEIYIRFCISKPLSCQDCTKKIDCDGYNENKKDKTCLILEPSLPGRYEGTGYREKTSGLIIDQYEDAESDIPKNTADEANHTNISKKYLRSIRKIKLNEEFMLYKNCPPCTFTAEQWEAVFLRFDHGIKQKEIAKKIGKERSTVGDRLRRAKKNMEKYYERKILRK